MVTIEYKGLMQAPCVLERSSPCSGRLWKHLASEVDALVKAGKAAQIQPAPIYKYPPEGQEEAIVLVLKHAEELAVTWSTIQ